MVFIDYRHILIFMVPITLILLGMGGHWVARRKKGSPVWTVARFVTVGFASLGGLLLFVVGCVAVFTKTVNSMPIYSEDRRHAARVTDFDAGATGGDTSVTVYASYGFQNKVVMSGGWKAVETQDIHWLSNSELLIEYPADTGYGSPACNNFVDINVICRPTNRHTWNH
jgi:hypothetical protein